MNKWFTIQGLCLTCSDEERDVQVKDKNGVPTGQTKKCRFTKIQVLADFPDKSKVAVNVTGLNLPSTFALPKVGESVSLPLKKFDLSSGYPEAVL